jgi:hypothetical protein
VRGSKVAASLAVVLAGSAPAVQQATLPPGLVRAGEYRVGPPAPPVAAGSVYDVGAFPLSTPELPPGEGRDATVAMCSVCHSVRYITMQPPLPPATWAATVRKMIDVHGAAIPEDVAVRITGYLQTQYGVR